MIRVIIQPFAAWLWIGGGVMGLGTLLAAWPGRRRRPTDPASATLPAPSEPVPTEERADPPVPVAPERDEAPVAAR